MKKFFALALSLVMCVGLLAGCGDKPQTENPPSYGFSGGNRPQEG